MFSHRAFLNILNPLNLLNLIMKIMRTIFIYIVCCSLPVINVHFAIAQHAYARYEIDAKRAGVAFYDKDALPRSREFVRLDSTYYVGYYYEGMYKYERAADYIGYKNCIQSLRKALFLFEKDFKNDIKTIIDGGGITLRSADIRQICSALYEGYSNIEQPDSAMWILNKVRSWALNTDFMEYHIKA